MGVDVLMGLRVVITVIVGIGDLGDGACATVETAVEGGVSGECWCPCRDAGGHYSLGRQEVPWRGGCRGPGRRDRCNGPGRRLPDRWQVNWRAGASCQEPSQR